MQVELVKHGPLSIDDIRPYVTMRTEETIQSTVPGISGPLKIMKRNARDRYDKRRPVLEYLVIRKGTKTFTADFSRGAPICLVILDGRPTVMLQKDYNTLTKEKSLSVLAS